MAEELEISGPEEFSLFQEDLVAEQLTYMDATLFQNVVPHHCLGCIWSRRDKKENKQLAQSIRATISQFNAVTNCVLSTILESKELKTQQRAKILEKWIRIARQCRVLNNFSSLKAIVSALQSTSVYRLKKTWACVPKDTMLMFEELSEIFSDSDNFAMSRELLMKVGISLSCQLMISTKAELSPGATQGTVPYLGTFLTDLVMLDTALQDYLEGGLINFEKRRREFEVIAQIKLLQSSCNSYCMAADEKFVQWFRRQRHLSDEESFHLSREIEAAPDKSTASGRAQKSVVKRKCPGSVTPIPSKEVPPVLPLYNQQSGDSCIIRTSVEEDRSGNIYRSILLSNQEKAPAVIQRAMEKHNLQSGSAEDYELVQIISADKELAIPPKANVFYAMNTQANFDFVLRRKAAAQEEPALHGL
ncbi:ral guanine nucleotide dissociation stimulator-like 1 [Patagioenas fasciata]|uniref:ral guanine nucleotide dissociation stimulator-like 1 n=1 Tax=Patagioenas fasciata TaxID=372321 RepID=UPI003A9A39EE